VKNNKTFIGGEPIWGNACVGNNGQPSYIEYARGYSESANLIIKTVLEQKLTVDIFIYPICFNMRHSVELRLKGLITELEKFKEYRDKLPIFDLEGSHDLGKIWCYIKDEIVKLDKRYEEFIQELDSYIMDIAMVDSTGQVFRYPMSNENHKHLVEVNTISLHILQKRFKELELLLDNLNDFNDSILEEYSCGTYTKKLSRLDILNLAKILPLEKEWDKLDKEKLKKDFLISGRDLSKAINLIKNHYEFNQLIGINKKLIYTNINDLILFFDIWIQIHEDKTTSDKPIIQSVNLSNKDDMISIFKEIKRSEEVFHSSWDKVLDTIKVHSFIEIRALFYFGRDNQFSTPYSEKYTSTLEYKIKEKLHSYKSEFKHILDKPNAFENILASLYFLGQYKIADSIRKRYIEIYSLNINSIKNSTFFRKEALLGYTDYHRYKF